ncbi:GNAT family N-acetyltransferase [Parahaliea aestuarii]|uniref:GNAT family N-acetyltransferase n=1 Tax=Parahaliea aestuarii TaxID=1852021 RepID=A0A5C8ZKM3_9GAMM|nr:GNAT family N-acetyltransferase [Parahaliea aestuarii]TXS89116.1 GNAT family N-acetyltransferase [Parahaliea aestuarii]
MEGKAAVDAGMPVIESASEGQLDALVATLSDAFEHDPILNWIFPDHRVYPDLFRLILRDSGLPRGMVQLEREGRGAALWLPPNIPFELPPGIALLKLVLRCLWRMGPGPLRRLQQQAGLFARHKPAEPHFHLQFIGARQRDQGQGVGAALLKAGLRACDIQHMPAYLECSNPRNLPLYQRHGFETGAEADLPNGGPHVWFMWREAR